MACFVAIRPYCSRCVNVCVQARQVYRPMLCLALWRATAEEEQLTCTEVCMASTHFPFLTKAELAPGFSSHAYQCYHSRGMVAAGWTPPVSYMVKKALVLNLSCAVLLSV